jgi:hypothetical protein
MHDAFTELAKRRTHLERLAAELPERSTFNMLWGVTTNLIERGVQATNKETASEILERLIGKLTMDWKYANMEDAQGSPEHNAEHLLNTLEEMLQTAQTALHGSASEVPAARH